MSESSSSNDLVDIEEELDTFFVRKLLEGSEDFVADQSKICANASSKYIVVHEYVPLLLCDVLALDLQQYVGRKRIRVYRAFGGELYFRSCILYARVVKRLVPMGSYNKYMVDDGSATLQVYIHKRSKDLESNWRLQDEVNALGMHSVLQNSREICGSLRRLLASTKDQLDTSNIAVGSNLLVYGQPSYFRGEMYVNAFSVCGDSKLSRDVEIAFKDELLHWYTQKFPRNRRGTEKM